MSRRVVYPDLLSEIVPGVYRFNGQRFYGEEVGVYLVELPDRVVLIDIPAFRPSLVEFVQSFNKPIEAIATHGPTLIRDTTKWQHDVGVRVSLHERDRADVWLQATPDTLL